MFGTEGALEIEHGQAATMLRLCTGANVHSQAWSEIMCPPVKSNFEKFVEAVASGKNDSPDFAHATKLQKVLDACFADSASAAMPL